MQHFGEMTQLPEIPGAKRHCSVIAGYDRQSGSPVEPGSTDNSRQLAATLGRIYPYRAAKQQAPGVAATDAKGTVATDAKGFPNWSGMTGRFPVEPGMTNDPGMTKEPNSTSGRR